MQSRRVLSVAFACLFASTLLLSVIEAQELKKRLIIKGLVGAGLLLKYLKPKKGILPIPLPGKLLPAPRVSRFLLYFLSRFFLTSSPRWVKETGVKRCELRWARERKVRQVVSYLLDLEPSFLNPLFFLLRSLLDIRVTSRVRAPRFVIRDSLAHYNSHFPSFFTPFLFLQFHCLCQSNLSSRQWWFTQSHIQFQWHIRYERFWTHFSSNI